MAGRDVRFDIIANDKASQTLKKVGRAADDAGDGFDGLGKSVDDAGGKVGKIGGILKGAAGAVAAAGVVVGGALVAGVNEAIERGAMAEKLGAQLGLSQNETYRYGALAGEIFGDAYGESLGQVNDAIKGVYQNIGQGSDEWTKDITGQVLTLTDVFEQDLGMMTAAVGQMLRTGLAGDAQEALDALTWGMQNGADKAGDLAETFNEYGTEFRQLGLSGADAVLLMTQGIKGGARDADVVADALKEFVLIAQSGSEKAQAGFEKIGLSAEKMQDIFAKGGPEARKALEDVFDRLRAIKDPAERSATAVDLFGTKAEDVQAALGALDLGKTTTDLQGLAGASEKVNEKMGKTLSARLTSLKRKFQNAAVEGIEVFVNALDGTSEVGEFDGALGKLNDTGIRLREVWQDDIQPALEDVWGVMQDVGGWLTGDFKPAMDDAVNKYLPAFTGAIDDIKDAFRSSGDQGAQFSDAISALGDVVIFMATNTIRMWAGIALVIGKTVQAARFGFDNVFIPSLRGLWRVVDFVFGGIVDAAATAFGWIPGIGPKLKDAQKKFRAFRDSVNAALSGIQDRYVNVNVRTVYSGGDNYGRKESTNGRGGRAVGGGLMVGAEYRVNESGQEMLKLNDRSAAVIPHAQSQRMLRDQASGGVVIKQLVVQGSVTSEENLARRLETRLQSLRLSGMMA